MQTYETIKNTVDSMSEDVEKFNSGNKAAGGRLRKALQEVKKLAQAMRIEIQAKKNASK